MPNETLSPKQMDVATELAEADTQAVVLARNAEFNKTHMDSVEKACKPDPAVAAIEFALRTDEGMEFLRCWLHGEFLEIRKEWPDAPEAVFVGADPLHPGTKF